ncbi:hypothetical protein BSY240_4548 (plasmid) [Agrobacterium sp. RAC06]|nr:hypothetical protein BSY240_4548 [Agrobacterium sp. RAC06]
MLARIARPASPRRKTSPFCADIIEPNGDARDWPNQGKVRVPSTCRGGVRLRLICLCRFAAKARL